MTSTFDPALVDAVVGSYEIMRPGDTISREDAVARLEVSAQGVDMSTDPVDEVQAIADVVWVFRETVIKVDRVKKAHLN